MQPEVYVHITIYHFSRDTNFTLYSIENFLFSSSTELIYQRENKYTVHKIAICLEWQHHTGNK